METKIYVVGVVLSKDGANWGLVGLFDTYDAALSACSTESHFIANMLLNVDYGDEIEYFPEMVYPLLQGKE
jgi:hypothetical protein